MTIEKRCSHNVLQPLETHRETGLRKAQAVGGPSKMKLLGKADKQAEVTGIRHVAI